MNETGMDREGKCVCVCVCVCVRERHTAKEGKVREKKGVWPEGEDDRKEREMTDCKSH